ncbi:MAG: phosphoribosylglycinamide formyltransferase [Bacteroidales bacterium]|nr:phosphoribosylglycinamide formyltransferase [Candidatus Equimonas faecalis]
MKNLAIFVSGSGTNCENIIRYFQNSTDVKCVLVLSNREDAYALVRAQRLGVPTEVVPKTEFLDESVLLPLLERYGVSHIILAGFLLVVPPFLVKRYDHRIINIHPALLPKYGGKGMYGHHVHEAVKAAGETESGITIHYVNEVCDGGDIIRQFSVPLSPDDTADDIAAKIHVLEQAHFPQVIEECLCQS